MSKSLRFTFLAFILALAAGVFSLHRENARLEAATTSGASR